MGRWTMRSIIGEAASPRMRMDKWISNNEEGYLIQRGSETPDRIQGHERQGNEEPPTVNMAI